MKKVRTAVFVALASALLLELVLQAGAFVVWCFHSGAHPSAADSTRTTILCVGDSYTFGTGASSPDLSYPAALEKLLRKTHGPELRVINGGWPGQDSHDVARLLQDQLRKISPDVVCVLVGINDRWSSPRTFHPREEAAPAADMSLGPGFSLEWRTGRLLAWALHNTELQAESARPKHADSPRRRNRKRGGDRTHRWALGKRRELAELTDSLLATYTADPDDRANAASLLGALGMGGRAAESTRIARELTVRHPDMALPWEVLGMQAYHDGDWQAAEQHLERSLQTLGESAPARRGQLLRKLGTVLAKHEPEKALRCFFDAAFADENVHATRDKLRSFKRQITRTMVTGYADRELAPEREKIVNETLDAVYAETADRFEVFEGNLHEIIAMCRKAHATPLLLGYPHPLPDVSEVQQRAAERTTTPIVDTRIRFRAELQSRPRRDLFIADGHPNDAGYAIVAALLAERMSPMLKR